MPAFVGAQRSLLSGSPSLVLDKIPNIAAAWGLRRLRSAYKGAAIRVRRSSDSTEQDIGFVGNELDVTALLNFVGSANGVIRTWYDQSGNGRNAAQGGTGSPPTLVTAGVLEMLNGRPTAVFGGGNVIFSGSLSVPQPFSQYVIASPGTTSARILIGSTSGTNAIFTESSRLKLTGGTALVSLMPVNSNICHCLYGIQNGRVSHN